MVIAFDPELEAALKQRAREEGVDPESLVVDAVRKRIAGPPPIVPRDDWERELLAIATDCGVSLSDEALSRETMYD
jgi:hypothetical protein